jgi:DNA-binding transcriptional ArsR family regulator
MEEYKKKFEALVEGKKKESMNKTVSIHYTELAIALGLSPSNAAQWLKALCYQYGGRYINGRCVVGSD